MGLVEFITKLFGNKSQKDMREIMPYVEKIKVLFGEIQWLKLTRGRIFPRSYCHPTQPIHMCFLA